LALLPTSGQLASVQWQKHRRMNDWETKGETRHEACPCLTVHSTSLVSNRHHEGTQEFPISLLENSLKQSRFDSAVDRASKIQTSSTARCYEVAVKSTHQNIKIH